MEKFLDEMSDQLKITQRAYAEDAASFESTVIKLIYFIALILIAIAKK